MQPKKRVLGSTRSTRISALWHSFFEHHEIDDNGVKHCEPAGQCAAVSQAPEIRSSEWWLLEEITSTRTFLSYSFQYFMPCAERIE